MRKRKQKKNTLLSAEHYIFDSFERKKEEERNKVSFIIDFSFLFFSS